MVMSKTNVDYLALLGLKRFALRDGPLQQNSTSKINNTQSLSASHPLHYSVIASGRMLAICSHAHSELNGLQLIEDIARVLRQTKLTPRVMLTKQPTDVISAFLYDMVLKKAFDVVISFGSNSFDKSILASNDIPVIETSTLDELLTCPLKKRELWSLISRKF